MFVKLSSDFYPDLVDREVLGKAPGDPDQLGQLVVLPLLGRRLVLLVVHQQAHLQAKLKGVSDFKSYQPVHFLVPKLLEKKSKGQNGVVDSVWFSKTRDLHLCATLL